MNNPKFAEGTGQTCPACGGGSFEPFIDFGIVPASGTYLLRPEDSYPTIHLLFEFCTHCAVIRRIMPKGFVCDYRETIHTTGHRRLSYVESAILPSLHEMGVKRDDWIIEVGANDGRFLDLLRGQGYLNLAAVEPAAHCCTILRAKGYRCWQSHLEGDLAEEIRRSIGPAAMVFCRHTLEHAPRPDSFVASLSSLLAEDGILFVEVPDAARILEDLHGYILWDEHLYNFLSKSLSALLDQCGMRVVRMIPGVFRTVRTLLCWARRGRAPIVDSTNIERVEDCRRFAGQWNQFRTTLQMAAKQWSRPIIGLGASHPQSNFLVYTGLGSAVSFLVDDDPAKVGRFAPIGSSVPVISSEQLFRMNPVGTIVRTAFGCDEWMDRICGRMSNNGTQIVDPFDRRYVGDDRFGVHAANSCLSVGRD